MLVMSRFRQRFQGVFAGHSRSCWGSARLGRLPVSAMPLAPASCPNRPFLLLHSKMIVGAVPWPLIVRERIAERSFPVFEGPSCPLQTLELAHTSCFLLPFSPSLAPCDIVTGRPPDLWASLCLFKLRIHFSETSPCVYICTSQWSKFR